MAYQSWELFQYYFYPLLTVNNCLCCCLLGFLQVSISYLQILTSCVNLEYEEASEGADIKPSLVSKTGAAKYLERTQFRAFEEALVKLTPSVWDSSRERLLDLQIQMLVSQNSLLRVTLWTARFLRLCSWGVDSRDSGIGFASTKLGARLYKLGYLDHQVPSFLFVATP